MNSKYFLETISRNILNKVKKKVDLNWEGVIPDNKNDVNIMGNNEKREA